MKNNYNISKVNIKRCHVDNSIFMYIWRLVSCTTFKVSVGKHSGISPLTNKRSK